MSNPFANDVNKINKWLFDTYGYAIDMEKPKFRVVWSNDQIEKRLGEFKEHTEGGIFLRDVKGIQDVPKYPFAADRWVLEHLCYLNPRGQVAKELVENSYSYEPLYIFQDKDSKFLPLNRDVVEIRVHFFVNRHKGNKGVYEEWFEKKEKAKRDRMRDMIGEYLRSPYFGDLVY